MRLSLSICHLTYFLIFSSSRPTVHTQYPLAQKCRPQYLFFNSRWRSKIFMALFPFRNPTTSDIEYLGGIDKTRCMWSSWTFPSKISSFFHSHSCQIISFTESATFPFSILKRYFGHQTMWYLHCHNACANFLYSLTEYLLLPSRVTTY